jgi:hypothetical protein
MWAAECSIGCANSPDMDTPEKALDWWNKQAKRASRKPDIARLRVEFVKYLTVDLILKYGMAKSCTMKELKVGIMKAFDRAVEEMDEP